MKEKDFANMPINELQAYCEKLQKELDIALCILRQRIISSKKHCKNPNSNDGDF